MCIQYSPMNSQSVSKKRKLQKHQFYLHQNHLLRICYFLDLRKLLILSIFVLEIFKYVKIQDYFTTLGYVCDYYFD